MLTRAAPQVHYSQTVHLTGMCPTSNGTPGMLHNNLQRLQWWKGICLSNTENTEHTLPPPPFKYKPFIAQWREGKQRCLHWNPQRVCQGTEQKKKADYSFFNIHTQTHNHTHTHTHSQRRIYTCEETSGIRGLTPKCVWAMCGRGGITRKHVSECVCVCVRKFKEVKKSAKITESPVEVVEPQLYSQE